METGQFDKLLCVLANTKVGGKTLSLPVEVLTSSTAYSSGDNIGGIIELPSVVLSKGGTAILKSIVVKDDADQKKDLTFLFFNENPSNGSTITDNSTFIWGNAAFPKEIAKVKVVNADYDSFGGAPSKAIADIDNLSKVIQANPHTQSIWMVIIAIGTPTYTASNSCLSVRLGFLQD